MQVKYGDFCFTEYIFLSVESIIITSYYDKIYCFQEK